MSAPRLRALNIMMSVVLLVVLNGMNGETKANPLISK